MTATYYRSMNRVATLQPYRPMIRITTAKCDASASWLGRPGMFSRPREMENSNNATKLFALFFACSVVATVGADCSGHGGLWLADDGAAH
jgi:hypothetical protein